MRFLNFLLRARAERSHDNYRADADHDAEQRQECPQPIEPNALQCRQNQLTETHAAPAVCLLSVSAKMRPSLISTIREVFLATIGSW